MRRLRRSLGKLEIDMEELAEFIVKAKKNCYAGNGEEKIAEDGSKILTFQEGNFHYTDNYDGFYQAPGSEIVRWQKEDGQRIWQMSYSGGMLPKFEDDEKLAKEVFTFLKKALSEASIRHPFRGPCLFQEDSSWDYANIWRGDLQQFTGEEAISNRRGNFIVFRQNYIGELVIPK